MSFESALFKASQKSPKESVRVMLWLAASDLEPNSITHRGGDYLKSELNDGDPAQGSITVVLNTLDTPKGYFVDSVRTTPNQLGALSWLVEKTDTVLSKSSELVELQAARIDTCVVSEINSWVAWQIMDMENGANVDEIALEVASQHRARITKNRFEAYRRGIS